MKKFEDHQAVTITNPDPEHAALRGMTGTVNRRLMRDSSAWVDVPGLPADLAKFPEGDDRHTHVNLWPEECSPA